MYSVVVHTSRPHLSGPSGSSHFLQREELGSQPAAAQQNHPIIARDKEPQPQRQGTPSRHGRVSERALALRHSQVKRVRCEASGVLVAKDKAIKRFIVRNIVDASAIRDIQDSSVIESECHAC